MKVTRIACNDCGTLAPTAYRRPNATVPLAAIAGGETNHVTAPEGWVTRRTADPDDGVAVRIEDYCPRCAPTYTETETATHD